MAHITYYKILTICLVISIDFSQEYSFKRINQDSTIYLTLEPGNNQYILAPNYFGFLPSKIIVNGNIHSNVKQITSY